MYRFRRLIGTDSWLLELSVKTKTDSFRVVFFAGAAEKIPYHYTERERPLEAEITDTSCCLIQFKFICIAPFMIQSLQSSFTGN